MPMLGSTYFLCIKFDMKTLFHRTEIPLNTDRSNFGNNTTRTEGSPHYSGRQRKQGNLHNNLILFPLGKRVLDPPNQETEITSL